jgi:hypothetical protein
MMKHKNAALMQDSRTVPVDQNKEKAFFSLGWVCPNPVSWLECEVVFWCRFMIWPVLLG